MNKPVSSSAPFFPAGSDQPLLVGPAGWHYPHWNGVIYPRPKPKRFHALEFLAKQFDTVEISASFDTHIKPEIARLWMAKVQANPRFLFTARLHRQFTHERSLNASAVDRFLPGLRELKRGKRLGALVMQFPWTFRFTKDNRDYFLELRRAFHEFPLVAEMRHDSWMVSEAVGTLIDHKVGFCNLDQPEHFRAMPATAFLTSPIAYFRLHGRQRAWWWNESKQSTQPAPQTGTAFSYSAAELSRWKERVDEVRGIAERTFCVFTNDAAGQSVINALQFGALTDTSRRPACGQGELVLSQAVA